MLNNLVQVTSLHWPNNMFNAWYDLYNEQDVMSKYIL